MMALASAILVAVLGYIAKYANDLAIARRRDRLDRVNMQLRLLYGPLFALSQATYENWKAFRSRVRPRQSFFSTSSPPTDAELAAWRLWIENTFMPLNRRMTEVIVANADLLAGDMPQVFLDLIAHVGAYEVVIARWARGDHSEHVALNNFPEGLREEVAGTYARLRVVQQNILATRRARPLSARAP